MVGETIISVAYGLDVQAKNDPYIIASEQGVYPLMMASVAGAFLVDSIPALKYVPGWLPFAGFKRNAKTWRELAFNMVNLPFNAAKGNIVSILAV